MTKNIIISFLSLVTFCVTPLFAQESCYEQYLREHNKKILTAEDADDSYEELKKTVLAKQMYGDSYLLMVDTVAQRTVITKVDGTYIADVHLTLVDSTWYMWLSVDPLADKYIQNSPYMYCNGNPIMMIDPDGRELGLTEDNGQTIYYYQKINGEWGFYDNDGVLSTSDFANKAAEAIADLQRKGLYGRTIADAILKDSRLVLLCPSATTNYADRSSKFVSWCGDNIFSLSHEFAHILSAWYGFANYKKWFSVINDKGIMTEVPCDEQWSTYVENLVRLEHGARVRTYYDKAENIMIDLKGEVWDIDSHRPLYPKQLSNFVKIYMHLNIHP